MAVADLQQQAANPPADDDANNANNLDPNVVAMLAALTAAVNGINAAVAAMQTGNTANNAPANQAAGVAPANQAGNAANNAPANQPAPAGGAPGGPLFIDDIHDGSNPYDISSRTGLTAFKEASEPLDHKFDGTLSTYPTFISSLKQKASHCCWDDQTTGILTIGGRNLFDEIHAISTADIEAVRTARTNPRARQNAAAMFKVLTGSITGNLHTNFMGHGRLPAFKDGPLLFKAISEYTTVNTMDAGAETNRELLTFDPSKYSFNIVAINQQLNNLFLRANHSPAAAHVDQSFKLFYTLDAYSKIKRPTEWLTFVRDRKRQVKAIPPTLTDCAELMREAVEQYNELHQFTGEYEPHLTTLEEQVVAMKALQEQDRKQRKLSPKKEPEPKKQKLDDDGSDNKIPSWANHTQRHARQGGKPYEMDDVRKYNGKTYYFHDTPAHKNGRRWYTHKCTACSTCKRHKENHEEENKEEDGGEERRQDKRKVQFTANLADATEKGDASATGNGNADAAAAKLDFEALLAHAYDRANDHEQRESIQAHLSSIMENYANS